MRTTLVLALRGSAAVASPGLLAKVPAEKAAELDWPKYTCQGAERAASRTNS